MAEALTSISENMTFENMAVWGNFQKAALIMNQSLSLGNAGGVLLSNNHVLDVAEQSIQKKQDWTIDFD